MTSTASDPLPPMPAVLLLEDNAPYRALLTEILTLAGFAVHAAPAGRRRHHSARATPRMPAAPAPRQAIVKPTP